MNSLLSTALRNYMALALLSEDELWWIYKRITRISQTESEVILRLKAVEVLAGQGMSSDIILMVMRLNWSIEDEIKMLETKG